MADEPSSNARAWEVAETYRSIPDAIVTIDAGSRILYANPAVEDLLGYAPHELIGRSLLTIIPERLHAIHLQGVQRYLDTGERRLSWDGIELPARRKDGTEVAVEIAFGEYALDGRRFFTGAIRDISHRNRAMQALRASEQRYRELFERNVAGVYRVSVEGTVLEVNEAMAQMLGYERQELMRSPAIEVYFDPGEREEWIRLLHEHGSLAGHVLRLRRKDGSPIWVLENSSLIEDPETGSRVIVGTAIDITDRKRLEDDLERMAYQDPLTGLANRRFLREMAVKALARVDRQGGRAGLLYLDLIRFKRINDAFGHTIGDQILADLGDRFQRCVRASDTIARVGGDEFALLLVGVGRAEDGLMAAQHLKECFTAPFIIDGETFHLHARIGVALYPDHAASFDELLSHADLAMHQIGDSDAGIGIYRSAGSRPLREDLVLEEELRRGLDREEFVLHYQPIYFLPDRTPIAVEALVRWTHPERGLLTAGDFIPLAEHAALIRKLDRWVLRTAVRQMRCWAETRGPGWVAVNLSPSTFEDPELPEFIERLVADEALAGERLALEVTERATMRDPERAAATLRGLQELGIRIVIDDFGRGHSSLAYLLHFPANVLKIDRFFVSGVGVDPAQERLVEGIIALCLRMEMQLIAEGVETEAQLEWLEARGCRFVQGFYLGRPTPAEGLAGSFS